MRASTPASYCDVDSASLVDPQAALAAFRRASPETLRQQAWPWLEKAGFAPSSMPFSRLKTLRRLMQMESNQHIGKIVLTW